MRLLTTIGFLALFSISALAKGDTTKVVTYGVNLSSTIHPIWGKVLYSLCCYEVEKYGLFLREERFALTPSFVLNYKKHSFLIGPRIFIPEEYYSRKGIQFTYEFYPGNSNKKFNIYFSYDFSYTYVNYAKYRRLSIDTGLYNSTNIDIDQYMSNIIAIGVKTKLSSQVYINANFGLGLGFYGYDSKDVVPDLPNYTDLNSKSGLLGNIDFKGMLKLGIGYNFKRLKNKTVHNNR